MESVELEEFQDLSQLTQEKQGVKSDNVGSAIGADVPMFSDTEMDNNHTIPDINANLVKNNYDMSGELEEAFSKQLEQCDGDDESCSENDFEIKQFSSRDELQVAMKESGIKNICNIKQIPDNDDSDYDEHLREPVKPVVSWIQCDQPECQKWRKLDVDDISNLSNQKWKCSMNSDPRRNDCDFSQEEWTEGSEDESVYTSFKPGVIVLAKMAGYPWWPGIIEDDPDFNSFFYLDRKSGSDKVTVSYHVTFFGKTASRAWLSEVSVRAFNGNETEEELGSLSYNRKSFKRQAICALADAKVAMKLSLERRIERFGFLSRYKGKRLPKNRNQDHSSSSKKKIDNILLDAARAKKRFIEEVEEPDSCEFLSQHSDDDADYLEDMPKRKKVPGKQTARQIKNNLLPEKDKTKKKIKKKERKRLLKQQKKEERKLKKMGLLQTKLENHEIIAAPDADADADAELESSVSLNKSGDLSVDSLHDATEEVDALMETDEVEVDPSIITGSQNQAELLVQKYSDPEQLKNFVDSLGNMTESFSERVEKERALKEEAASKKKLREEKKMALEMKRDMKIKKQKEKLLQKAKAEKKLTKSKALKNLSIENKLVKKNIKKDESGEKKVLPSFDNNLKKKKVFQVKSQSGEPCKNMSEGLNTQNDNVMNKMDMETAKDKIDEVDAPTKEKDSEEKKKKPTFDLSLKKKKVFQVKSKSGEPIKNNSTNLHAQNENMTNENNVESLDEINEKSELTQLGNKSSKQDTLITENEDIVATGTTKNDPNSSNEKSVSDSKDLSSVEGENEENSEGVSNDIPVLNQKISAKNHVAEKPPAVAKCPFMSALDNSDIDSACAEDNQDHKGLKINETKQSSATKSLFMSALDVEEAISPLGDAPENNTKADMECEGENLPKLVQPTLPVESENNETEIKEMPKLAKPTFKKAKKDAPKVVPSFSAGKRGTKK